MDEVQVIVLPHGYRYQIVKLKDNEVRANINSGEELDRWMRDYSELSKTSWNFVTKKGTRYVLRKKFFCHHSARNKLPREKRKLQTASKNLDCPAEIVFTIKKNTSAIRKQDKYAKNGLFAVIEFVESHNHPLDTAHFLRRLKPNKSLRTFFIKKYFEKNMSASRSVMAHREYLSKKYSEGDPAYTNAQINPLPRTVEYWYGLWKRQKFRQNRSDPNATPERMTTPPSSPAQEIEIREQPDIEQIRLDLRNEFERIVNEMPYECAKNWLNILKNLKTPRAINEYFRTLPASLRRRRRRTVVRVQTIARRRKNPN